MIYGPSAVGKMAVGMELERQTGLTLFHNHQTIDLLTRYFKYGSPSYQRCISLFRLTIMREVAKSRLPGLIFTLVRAFGPGRGSDDKWVRKVEGIFRRKGAQVFHVELYATQAERLRRNRTPLRLREKPSKRNVLGSDNNLLAQDREWEGRLNTNPGQVTSPNYLRIDNTRMSIRSAVRLIRRHFRI